jgi:hypothetical protein
VPKVEDETPEADKFDWKKAQIHTQRNMVLNKVSQGSGEGGMPQFSDPVVESQIKKHID